MHPVAAVFAKESIDHLRDRRSLLSALLTPLFGPVAIAVTLSFVARWQSADRPLDIAVVGREHAPHLCAFLESQGAHLTTAPADYERRIRDDDLEVALVIPDDYGGDFTDGHAATVEVVADGSNNRAHRTVARTEAALRGYSHQIGALRLIARGVSPELGEALDVEEDDVATPQQHAATLLAMIPMLFLIGAFIGGMHVAIDSVAGERERASLEPLLINPVGTGTLVAGKWLTTAIAGAVSILLMLVVIAVAMARVPLDELGVRFTLGWLQAGALMAAALPLVLLTGALQMLISTFARSFREAQSYVSLAMLVPMVPVVALSLDPVKPASWMYGVPVLGQQILMTDILRGDPTTVAAYAVCAVATAVAAALCLLATARLLGQERIVFGG